jgi:hypothetical protein
MIRLQAISLLALLFGDLRGNYLKFPCIVTQIKFWNKLMARKNHGQRACRVHGFVDVDHFMAGAGL